MKILSIIGWAAFILCIGLIIYAQFNKLPEFLYGVIAGSAFISIASAYIGNWLTKRQIKATEKNRKV